MLLHLSGDLQDNDFIQLAKDDINSLDNHQPYLFPVSEIEKALTHKANNQQPVGIWFDSDEEPEQYEEALASFEVIAVNFPVFTDGRGYSIAWLIRERFGFQGELRAIGDVLIDQLFYMKRCGFNSFDLREDQNPEDAKQTINSFDVVYQHSSDHRSPTYQARHQRRIND